MDHCEAIRVGRQLKCKRITKAMLLQGNEALQEKTAQLTTALQECKERTQIAEAARCEMETALRRADGEAAELRAELARVRSEHEMEAKAAAQPATAEALMPASASCFKCWICMSDACYRVSQAVVNMRGKAWELLKHSDGSVRTVRETDCGDLTCDCAHHTQKGQGAPDCRHRRAIKALKHLFDTCGPRPPARTAAVQPVAKTNWLVVEEEENDRMLTAA